MMLVNLPIFDKNARTTSRINASMDWFPEPGNENSLNEPFAGTPYPSTVPSEETIFPKTDKVFGSNKNKNKNSPVV